MISEISSPITSARSFFKHPIFIILIAGIVVRLMISPFMEVGYDSDFWATIIRNVESGEGLYGLEGYYYTPVWGYILSFLSVLQESFLNIDILGVRALEAFPIESYTDWFFSATVTSMSFNIWIKIPFTISDILVGYLIYWLIKDKTNDIKKATIGFALWFLCPLVICVTSISGMFDTFSVLFTLLCIIMVRKDKTFLAGMLFTFAVLTKFFPAYFLFILLAYIIVIHRNDGKTVRSMILAAAGALIALVVLMLPQILEGDLAESLLFITNRAGSSDVSSIMDMITSKGAILAYAAGIVASLLLAYKLSKKDASEVDDSLFKFLLIMAAFMFIYPPTPQYVVLLIPFLAIYIVTKDLEFKKSWILLSIGGTLFIMSGNAALFFSFGEFANVVSLESLVSLAEWFQTAIVAGISPMQIMYYSGGILLYSGILSILVLFLRKEYAERQAAKAEIEHTE